MKPKTVERIRFPSKLCVLILLTLLATFGVFVSPVNADETKAERQARAVAWDQTQCDNGDYTKCNLLSEFYWMGEQGVIKDIPRSMTLLKKSCVGGNIGGCVSLGHIYAWLGRDLDTQYLEDDALGVIYLKMACDGDKFYPNAGVLLRQLTGPIGCIELKTMIKLGRGVTLYKDGTLMFYNPDCHENAPPLCSKLGVVYYTNEGRTDLKTQSLSAYQSACDTGGAKGCFNAAYLYDLGDIGHSDKRKAMTLYLQACSTGAMRACSNLGVMYLKGSGAPIDKIRAEALFRQACDGGDAGGCFNDAAMYSSDDGLAIDHVRASQLFDKAIALDPADTNLKTKASFLRARPGP